MDQNLQICIFISPAKPSLWTKVTIYHWGMSVSFEYQPFLEWNVVMQMGKYLWTRYPYICMITLKLVWIGQADGTTVTYGAPTGDYNPTKAIFVYSHESSWKDLNLCRGFIIIYFEETLNCRTPVMWINILPW